MKIYVEYYKILRWIFDIFYNIEMKFIMTVL